LSMEPEQHVDNGWSYTLPEKNTSLWPQPYQRFFVLTTEPILVQLTVVLIFSI
jgi:hypothetical protein